MCARGSPGGDSRPATSSPAASRRGRIWLRARRSRRIDVRAAEPGADSGTTALLQRLRRSGRRSARERSSVARRSSRARPRRAESCRSTSPLGPFQLTPRHRSSFDATASAARARVRAGDVRDNGPREARAGGPRPDLPFARTMIDWLQLVPEDVGCSVAPFHFSGGLRATLLIPWLSARRSCASTPATAKVVRRRRRSIRPISPPGFIHRGLLRRGRGFGADRPSPLPLRATAGRSIPRMSIARAAVGVPVIVDTAPRSRRHRP